MSKRDIPEINAGSMADIAFLLLLFFLVTTTMDKDQAYLRDIPKKIDVPPEDIEIQERNILKILEGDCETAVGIHSKIDENKITVEAELFSLDGSQRFYEKKSDKLENFRELGNEIGQILKIKSNNTYKK